MDSFVWVPSLAFSLSCSSLSMISSIHHSRLHGKMTVRQHFRQRAGLHSTLCDFSRCWCSGKFFRCKIGRICKNVFGFTATSSKLRRDLRVVNHFIELSIFSQSIRSWFRTRVSRLQYIRKCWMMGTRVVDHLWPVPIVTM